MLDPEPKKEKNEREHLEWLCTRMSEELKTRWTQIEGTHTRTTVTMTVILGFAGFLVATLKILAIWQAVVLVLAVLLPAILAACVLWPRRGSEIDPDNYIDEKGEWLHPENLALRYRQLLILRDAELESKGTHLRATLVSAILAVLAMLVLLATGEQRGTDGKSAGSPPPEPTVGAPPAPGEVRGGREGQGR